MAQAASVPDLLSDLSGLLVDAKKKKRSHRLLHDASFMPPAGFGSTVSSAAPSPALNGPSAYFTPLQPSTPAFSQQFFTPMNGGQTPTQPQFSPAPTTLNVTNPVNMASGQNSEISLPHARKAQQDDFCTPLSDDQGNSLGYRSFLSFQNVLPPMAGTQYHAVDQGTATPRHMRSTMYNVPESETLRKATRLPMAVTIRPFAPLLPTEDPVPVVDMSTLGEASALDPMDVGPPRCNRCRTYINPSMLHFSLGKFTCNVCQFPNNDVPSEYDAPVDPMTNQRTDRESRPELHKGVYDIIVPGYYNVGGAENKPLGLHHVFLVDISQQSIARQLPVLLADALRAAIFDYGEEADIAASKLRFSIILFDKKVHFFNLSPQLDSAQICTSGDLEDPFMPFHHGLFADQEESRHVIEDALNNLEMLCSDNTLHDSEPAFAVAVRTATLCLEGFGGGKITAFLSTLPTWGPGSSKLKENRLVGRAQLAEAEKALYAPDNDYYKLLAKDMIAANVGLDVFVVSETPSDVANIGWLASATGGNVRKWSNFLFERDGRSLTSQVVASVRKCRGYQGLLKLRCSNGLQVSQYYGFTSNADGGILGYGNSGLLDPVIPVLNEDQTFTVLLEYDGSLNTKYDCHFQAALLYTDPQGVRKVRVINLVLAVSERLQDVFNFVDQDAVVTTIVRDTISFLGKDSISDLRKSLSEKLVDIFAQYRLMSEQNHNRNSTMTNQLIFPDSMKHLPNYFLAFMKSKALRDLTSISLDSRLCDIFQMLYMPIEQLVFHLYPALIELHSLAENECVPYSNPENVNEFINLPHYKALTAVELEAGAYILCNGTSIFVRIHPEANPLLLKDLFGSHVQSVNDIDPLLDSLPDLPTHISQQARNAIAYFREKIIGSGSIDSASIIIVRDGIDAITQEFRDCLVEDKLASKTLNTAPSLSEFLASLHKAVKVKIESEPKSRGQALHQNETLAQRMIHF